MNWYEVENIDTIDSPALLFYKARIQKNIDTAVSMIKDASRLRPHVKTNKTKEVCQMLMDAGIEKFKCATIAEAEMLAQLNAKDVLLAYQPVGPKANRLLSLVQNYPATHFSCLVDDVKTARRIGDIFINTGFTARVWIDINTGMNRTGIHPESANDLLDALLRMRGIDVGGVHIYDGHIINTELADRARESDVAFAKLQSFLRYFTSRTGRSPVIIAGGSPTFQTHIKRNVECSPGTFVFWDAGYKRTFPVEPFDFAALLITRVISIVDDIHITTDLGYKSVAAENPLPRVFFLNAPDTKPVFQNEEHLILQVSNSKNYNPGDVLYGVPEHICPTVALYDDAYVIDGHQHVDTWNIVARARKIKF